MYIVWDRIIQIEYNFFHVFRMKTGFLSTDSTYSRIPGDHGGSFFFRLKEFFLALVFVQIGLLQFVIYCLIFAK
jgi:hypothetical protein